jgi:hypothetical protein
MFGDTSACSIIFTADAPVGQDVVERRHHAGLGHHRQALQL